MAQDEHEMLELLRFELKFLEDGGYGRSPRTPWRPTFIFEDSPSCPNLGDPARTHPCSECLLMKFVPMSCRMKTSRAALSPSTKLGRPLIISIAAARSWKWKKPLPAGYATKSLGLNSNLRNRKGRCWRNAANSRMSQKPRKQVACQFEQGLLEHGALRS